MKNKVNQVIKSEGQEIVSSIERIKKELEITKNNFDITTNEVLIDSYIYEIIALNKKYEYFLQLAKQIGLVADGFKKIS